MLPNAVVKILLLQLAVLRLVQGPVFLSLLYPVVTSFLAMSHYS